MLYLVFILNKFINKFILQTISISMYLIIQYMVICQCFGSHQGQVHYSNKIYYSKALRRMLKLYHVSFNLTYNFITTKLKTLFLLLVCPDGYYGYECKAKCSCENGANCSKSDGSCDCPPGYIGASCSQSKWPAVRCITIFH